MEPKFEVQVTLNHKMLSEFNRYALGKVWKLCVGGMALLAAMYLLVSITDASYLATAAFAAVCVIPVYFLPELTAWDTLRQRRKKNGGQLPLSQVLIGDAIEDMSDGINVTCDFDRIEKVVHLKHSYALMIDKRSGILLTPNGFTKGSFAQLKQFLREKRPDLVIPE